jgi:hypothetical protein
MKSVNYKISIEIILLVFFILNSFNSNSQNVPLECDNIGKDSCFYEENLLGEFFMNRDLYKGPKYFNSTWNNGEIILENNKRITNKILNYHLLSNQLIWLRSGDFQQIIVSKDMVKEFIIFNKETDKKEIFRKITFKTIYLIDDITTYLQVLSEGKISIYAHRKERLNNNYTELIPINEYYIQIGTGPLKYFNLNRWALYFAVGGYKAQIKKIVRSNHLRIRREEDLIRAVEIFNHETEGN